MARFSSLVLLPALAAASRSTVEIAPRVEMPLINDGSSNHSVWVQTGGVGLDTAFEYGEADQQDVGRAVRASARPRSDFFVTSKVACCPNSGSFPYGQRFCKEHPEVRDTVGAIHKTLELLDVEYIDLLLVHWACDTVEQSLETYSHLEEFVRAGKVRAIGVSNFNASLLDAFVPRTTIKPAVNQVSFSIGGHWAAESKLGTDDATWARSRELGITLSAWAPLGGVSGVDVLHNPQVVEVAKSIGVSTAQVGLRWLVQQGIPAITSTSSPSHAASDLKVYDFELTEEQMALLSAIPPPSEEQMALLSAIPPPSEEQMALLSAIPPPSVDDSVLVV